MFVQITHFVYIIFWYKLTTANMIGESACIYNMFNAQCPTQLTTNDYDDLVT